MRKAIFLLVLTAQLAAPLLGQQQEPGNWLMYFGLNRISDDFSIHTEIQYRNHTAAPTNIEQLLLRTGLNYHFSGNAFATFGYGYVASHVYESDQTDPEIREHRIWQQLIMTNTLGRVKFEHRYRIEQRWVSGDYRNRLRYRLMLFVPLNNPVIEEGTFFLGVYDEIFMNTQQVFFDRNRFYGALGYQINGKTNIQFGMLNQQLNDSDKWYLQVAVAFNPDLRKVIREEHKE